MAKTQVGLARNIKVRWLNKTVEYMHDTGDIDELKTLLNEYLSFEITSKDNIRKTRDILLNLLVRNDDGNKHLKDQAYMLIEKYPDDAPTIYWALMLLRYPVFVDTCDVIGSIASMQDAVSLEQIKQGLYNKWGERNTLLNSTPKVIQTMKDFGAIEGTGKYTVIKTNVNSPEVSEFVIKLAMITDSKSYYTYDELNSFSFLFPYTLSLSKELFYDSADFAVHNTGGEMAISIINNQ